MTELVKMHVENMNNVIKDALAERSLEPRIRVPKNSFQTQLFVKKSAVTAKAPLIFGDALHNLKCALDIFSYGMIGNKAKAPGRIFFPFANSEEGLSGSITNQQISLVGEKVARMVKNLGLDHNANKYLYAIQYLDTRDQHLLIITMGQVPKITDDNFNSFGFPGSLVRESLSSTFPPESQSSNRKSLALEAIDELGK